MLFRQMKTSKHKGPFFAKNNDKKATIGDYNLTFRSYLTRLRMLKEGLFYKGTDIKDCSYRQSLRHG